MRYDDRHRLPTAKEPQFRDPPQTDSPEDKAMLAVHVINKTGKFLAFVAGALIAGVMTSNPKD